VIFRHCPTSGREDCGEWHYCPTLTNVPSGREDCGEWHYYPALTNVPSDREDCGESHYCPTLTNAPSGREACGTSIVITTPLISSAHTDAVAPIGGAANRWGPSTAAVAW
jgi:hypothetical protein